MGSSPIRWHNMLRVLIFAIAGGRLSTTWAQRCPMEIWVYRNLEHCDDAQTPAAIGTMYADNTCRTIETSTDPSDDNYGLLPGTYSAYCTDGDLHFEQSGCTTDTCSSSSGADVCDRNFADEGALFSRLSPPEYAVQDPSLQSGLYSCLILSATSTFNVSFAIFGNCSQAECALDYAATPTASPGVAATPAPTPTPTLRSTPQPTTPPPSPVAATSAPDDSNTASPSPAPVLLPATPPPTTQFGGTMWNAAMVLSYMDDMLDATSTTNWQTATAAHMNRVIARSGGTENMILKVELVSQTVLPPLEQQDGEGRLLQDESTEGRPLQLEFQSYVNATQDVEGWVNTPFATPQDRTQYLIRLGATNDAAFDELVQVDFFVDGDVPPNFPNDGSPNGSNGPPDSSGSSTSLGLILGIVAGAVLVLVAITGFLIFRGSSARDGSSSHKMPLEEYYHSEEKSPATTDSPASRKQQQQQIWATNEITVDRGADDVSTLGGSVLAGLTIVEGGGTPTEDEQTATVDLDYDYNRATGNGATNNADESFRSRTQSAASTSLFSGMSTKLGKSMYGDDDEVDDDESFDQLFTHNNDTKVKDKDGNVVQSFEVRAPAGMLGMVVDTPQGSTPQVRAIRTNSVLFGKVLVGDVLLSVDGDDVTHLSAVEVSNLISRKSGQSRLMVFTRPQNHE